jgi:hypothetical protein
VKLPYTRTRFVFYHPRTHHVGRSQASSLVHGGDCIRGRVRYILGYVAAHTTLSPSLHTILWSHIASFWVVATLELQEVAADHIGYDCVELPSGKLHDHHHDKFN